MRNTPTIFDLKDEFYFTRQLFPNVSTKIIYILILRNLNFI